MKGCLVIYVDRDRGEAEEAKVKRNAGVGDGECRWDLLETAKACQEVADYGED
ncbi:unnamed protein product [Linum tenue]|nr:unnamed protein product [Linum tenue]